MQSKAISSCPITGSLGEETNTCLTTASPQVAAESEISLRVEQLPWKPWD